MPKLLQSPPRTKTTDIVDVIKIDGGVIVDNVLSI